METLVACNPLLQVSAVVDSPSRPGLDPGPTRTCGNWWGEWVPAQGQDGGSWYSDSRPAERPASGPASRWAASRGNGAGRTCTGGHPLAIFVLGIVIFLGAHSVRLAASGWRAGVIAARGERGYKGYVTIGSFVGLALIVWGFILARADPVIVYVPPAWGRHVALALMVPAFVLLAASGPRVGRIKAAVRHPMITAVMLWGAAHLFANGDLAAIVLFGSFLLWSVVDRIAVGRREPLAGQMSPGGYDTTADLIAIVAGLVLYGLFVWRLHFWLFGVSPAG
jgi:uncharacterized membrane protein